MKIAAYDIASTSSRIFVSASYEKTTAKLTTANVPDEKEPERDKASISDQARQALSQAKKNQVAFDPGKAVVSKLRGYDGRSRPRNSDELQLNILLRFIEQITGKKFDFKMPDLSMQPGTPGLGLQFDGQGQSSVRTLSIEQTSAYYEYEAVSFNSTGVVRTADGQEIAFNVSLSMSREYAEYSSTSLTVTQQMKNACDPLVINYAGTAASLTDTKFSFDLLADGVARDISFVGQGSGFLALDQNGDGNGWIDENDDIYSKLLVWSKDSQGNDVLYSLKELDIGAIYLGDLQTQFTVGNSSMADGYVRSTSIFLKDSGGAGTIQHVDLVI